MTYKQRIMAECQLCHGQHRAQVERREHWAQCTPTSGVLLGSRGPAELSFLGNTNQLVVIVIYLFFLASNSRYAFAITPLLGI